MLFYRRLTMLAPLAEARGVVILCRKRAAAVRQGSVGLGCDLDDLIRLKEGCRCFLIAVRAKLLMRIVQRHMDVGPKLANHGVRRNTCGRAAIRARSIARLAQDVANRRDAAADLGLQHA